MNALKERLEQAVAAVRAHEFVALAVGIAGLGVIVAAGIGATATSRADAWRESAERLERVTRSADRWAAGFEASTPAESAAWHRSERELEQLDLSPTGAVAMATLVARRAEALGILDARVRVHQADSLAQSAVRTVAGRSFDQAPVALGIEFRADYPTLVRYIGALPVQARVREIRASRGEAGLRVRLLLTLYKESGG